MTNMLKTDPGYQFSKRIFIAQLFIIHKEEVDIHKSYLATIVY